MSRAQRIETRLNEALSPTHMHLVDESHQHSVPAGAESHFNLLIVTEAFEGQRLVQRHQAVYRALETELDSGLHALTLKTLTPDEYESSPTPVQSPKCLGGSKPT
jgi:BolA protein